MFRNPLLLAALSLTGAIALWGLIDNPGLERFANHIVALNFTGRAWFIMLTVSFMLIACIYLALSPYGRIKLGADDDEPEFPLVSWLTMVTAAGMGVGLVFWGTAEPVSHYLVLVEQDTRQEAAEDALFLTIFHWGLHAWAIYALTGLVIAYFSFRRGCPILVGAPILETLGSNGVTRSVAWLSNLLAIYAIAIGLGGSVAMGTFQLREGVSALFGLGDAGLPLTLAIFAVLCLAFLSALTVDLGTGIAKLSNAAIGIAVALLIFILLAGPTFYLMGGIVQAIGQYFTGALRHGFRTFTFMDERVGNWFQAWTLTYMVWWMAWAPFVGVFIARISRGRTIRDFLLGVVLVPTCFSIVWFGVFGGVGFFGALRTTAPILEVVQDNISAVTFFVLGHFPMPKLTIFFVVIAILLFSVISVVSASLVLGMFSTNGNANPSVRIKLSWGVVLAGLGLVMILAGDIDSVKSIIALGALPFIFILLTLVVCFLKALKTEQTSASPAESS